MKKISFLIILIIMTTLNTQAQEDPYIWLEEVNGERSLDFVEKQNKITYDKLINTKDYQPIFDKTLEILNSKDKIAYPSSYGDYIYNFWKDEDHIRGIWRRTTVEDYKQGDPEWETLLDIDKMSEEDDIKWVYKASSGLYPDYNRFLVRLSKGGGDAVVTKEYDAVNKKFIEDGFYIGESKGGCSYIDENTLFVYSDFGENSMTTSGYPKQVKIWKRGTELSEAEMIFDGESTDIAAYGFSIRDGDQKHSVVLRSTTFYTREYFVQQNDKLVKLDLQKDASLSGLQNDQLIVDLKSDWEVNGQTYSQGSIVSLDFSDLVAGRKNIQLVYEPDEFSSVSGISFTKSKMLINVLKDVISELHVFSNEQGRWVSKKVEAPDYGTISIVNTDDSHDQYYFTFENFLSPSTMYSADAKSGSVESVKSLKSYFDGSKYSVEQFKVSSKDGTMVPYFLVRDKNVRYDGSNPTLVYAYGGFEVPSRPFYSGTFGSCWLDKGGVFVLANIRGGGEYGPRWHQAGLKEKRQNVYDDFYVVAEDLISKKITSPKNLGIMGGSNGGLLVGVAFTQRPDLYNAVVCQVPLLDMKRYNKLLAGASWMGEYGNPDIPEEWAYIKEYSPYQNLRKGEKYPEVFFYTSTRDDRVHPGHARKMAAKMMDMGYPVYYYENTEGGHAGSSTNDQRAKSTAMSFSYLLQKLK